MYYIFIENGKINGAGEAKQLTEGVINYEVSEYVFNDFINYPTKYVFKNDKIVLSDSYDLEQAELKRIYLIEEVNYNLKAKYAYTGVLFDYNDEEIIFETNKNSITLINTTMLNLLGGFITEVSDWKCRSSKKPFTPIAINFTIDQFKSIVKFSQHMITQAFSIEKNLNIQINELTVEQLLNEDFVKQFEENMILAYSDLKIKIENLFK